MRNLSLQELEELEVPTAIFKAPSNGQESESKFTVWTLLAMPHQKTAAMGIESETRDLSERIRSILNFNPQRILANGRIRGKKKDDGIQLLQSITNGGSPQREPASDPLLWLSRVWWSVRQTTLALPDLEFDVGIQRAFSLPPWETAPSRNYLAMASWACGLCRSEYGNHQLCLKILDRLHGTKKFRSQSFPNSISDDTASHWLLWDKTLGTKNRYEAYDAIRDLIYPVRRESLSPRSVDPR